MGDGHVSNSSSNPKQYCVTTMYNPDTKLCSQCIIWKQSGYETEFLPFHPLKNSRHVVQMHLAFIVCSSCRDEKSGTVYVYLALWIVLESGTIG